MNRKQLALLAALSLPFVAVPPSPAGACSCANGDPRDRLTAADGAFIGELVGRRETGPLGSIVSSGRDVIYTFEVADVFKGDLGATVDVHSPAEGVSCGFEVTPGEEIGVLLEASGGKWQSGLCGQIEPRELRAAAAPLPAPSGRGPVAFVLGGGFGEARLLALDRHARTLSYGFGAGYATHLSPCPGAGRLLEVVGDHPRASTLALRKLPGLDLIWEQVLRGMPRSHDPMELTCLDRRGAAYVFTSDRGEPVARSRLLRVSRGKTSVLYRGSARSIAFGEGIAYVNEGSWGRDISRLNLRSGQVTPVITGPRYTSHLVLSPDGSALATQVWGDSDRGSRPPQAVVMDHLESSPPRLQTTIIGHANRIVTGDMVWLDTDRFGFFPGGGDNDRAIVFDRSLRELGGFDDWSASTTLLVGDIVVGVGWGRFSVAELPNGPPRTARHFESPETFALAAIPGVTPVLGKARSQPPSEGTSQKEIAEGDATTVPIAASAVAIALLVGYFVARWSRGIYRDVH